MRTYVPYKHRHDWWSDGQFDSRSYHKFVHRIPRTGGGPVHYTRRELRRGEARSQREARALKRAFKDALAAASRAGYAIIEVRTRSKIEQALKVVARGLIEPPPFAIWKPADQSCYAQGLLDQMIGCHFAVPDNDEAKVLFRLATT